MTPSVSAYAYFWSQRDYNAKPFALLRCKVEAHVTPGVQETWAPHTASGCYVSNAWEHYKCHKDYISDTTSIRTCLTVFFKHKDITMLSITPENALIEVADYLTDAISGLVPKTTITADATDQLMAIFKLQAKANKDTGTAQRVLGDCAQAERMIKEEQELEKNANQKEIQHRHVTPSPTFEVEYTKDTALANRALPQITHNKFEAPQLANTHQQQRARMLTQDFMLECMEIPGFKALFTPRQAAARQYPLQFLFDFAYSVLDDKTGNLLKYCHLMKHPKYKDVWIKSFGTEIWCLATTVETIFFIKKDEIPQEHKGYETYARILCVYLCIVMERRTSTARA
jgi:hypothetical protein